jgi:hypothetical protein
MRHAIALTLCLGLALPAVAQEAGTEGVMAEMEPALRDLQGALQNLDAYHPPEVLPNGDILIRRKVPLEVAPGVPEVAGEGEVDL